MGTGVVVERSSRQGLALQPMRPEGSKWRDHSPADTCWAARTAPRPATGRRPLGGLRQLQLQTGVPGVGLLYADRLPDTLIGALHPAGDTKRRDDAAVKTTRNLPPKPPPLRSAQRPGCPGRQRCLPFAPIPFSRERDHFPQSARERGGHLDRRHAPQAGRGGFRAGRNPTMVFFADAVAPDIATRPMPCKYPSLNA